MTLRAFGHQVESRLTPWHLRMFVVHEALHRSENANIQTTAVVEAHLPAIDKDTNQKRLETKQHHGHRTKNKEITQKSYIEQWKHTDTPPTHTRQP